MSRLGIRFKLAAALLLAAGMPLAVGLLSIDLLGQSLYRAQKGQLFETIGKHLAISLRTEIDHQVVLLRTWIQSSGLAQRLPRETSFESDEAIRADVRAIERRWPDLRSGDEPLRSVLENPAAEILHEFQTLHPRYAEILITDSRGRLTAASNKTSDYDQADETWWQKADRIGMAGAWLEGVHFDESAGVYSVDIAMPIFGEGPATQPLGVIKAVLDISPFLSSVERVSTVERAARLQAGRGDAALHRVAETIAQAGGVALQVVGEILGVLPQLSLIEPSNDIDMDRD